MNTLSHLASITISSAYDAVVSLLPVAVELGMINTKIGRVAIGIGLTAWGCLQINEIQKERLWIEVDGETCKLRLIKEINLVISVVAICFGFYNIASGIHQLLPVREIGTSSTLQKLEMLNCDKRIQTAQSMLMDCPLGKELWDQVLQEGAISIECVNPEIVPFGAGVEVDLRKISISYTEKNTLSSLAFELGNLKRAKNISEIWKNQCSQTMDVFVLAMEKIEYESVKDTYQLFDRCTEIGFWPNVVQEYQAAFENTSDENWKTFEGFLKDQEKFDHMDDYRRNWLQKCLKNQ